MKKTVQQIEAESRQRAFLKQRREQFANQFTEVDSYRLGNFAAGGAYTDPEITASMGLTPINIDPSLVHQTVFDQSKRQAAVLQDRKYLSANQAPDKTEELNFDLSDLLTMSPQEMAVRHDHQPAWYDKVDPDGFWRKLPVPSQVSHARDILNLNEAQALKFMLSMPYEDFMKIPGMKTADKSQDLDPTLKPGDKDYGQWTPSNFDAVKEFGAKFEHFNEAWTQHSGYHEMTKGEMLSADIANTAKNVGQVVQFPFKVASYMTPDRIGYGGVDLMNFTEIGDVTRKAVKGAAIVFEGVRQVYKNMVDYHATHPESIPNPSGYFLPDERTPEQVEKDKKDFYNLMVNGNIITQIAKQIKTNRDKVDIGGGFFPEGTAMEDAMTARDSSLPKINGKSYTQGNAIVDRLVKEEYIDKDGYWATFISGAWDATVTLATDPTIVGPDPIAAVMKKFGVTRVTAGSMVDARLAEKVEAGIVEQEKLRGLKNPNRPNVIEGYLVGEVPEDIQVATRALPPGTVLTPEAEAATDAAALEILGRHTPDNIHEAFPVVYKEDQTLKEVRKRNFGVTTLPGGRQVANVYAIEAMPYTADGVKTLQTLGSFENAGALYDAMLGNIPPGLAVQIQDYVLEMKRLRNPVDINEIHRMVMDGWKNGDPMYNTGMWVPSVRAQAFNQTGATIAQAFSGSTRQLATMPNSLFFSFEDPIGSLKDMNRLMTVMKVPVAQRHSMLARAMDSVVKEGPKARFELANEFMYTVMAPALRSAGAPESWIRAMSKYSKWDNGVHNRLMDSMGRGYPLYMLEDGVGDVIRTIDAMNTGFLMMSPENFKQATREVTNLWKLAAPFRGPDRKVLSQLDVLYGEMIRAEKAGNDIAALSAKQEIAKLESKHGTRAELSEAAQTYVPTRTNEAINTLLTKDYFLYLQKIQTKLMKPIALGAPIPIHLTTKVVMENMVRIAAEGNLSVESLKILGTFGHVNYNTHGEVIRSSKEILKLNVQKRMLDDHYINLDLARKAGDIVEESRLQSLINDIEKDYGSVDQIKKNIQVYLDRQETILPGMNRKLGETVEGITYQDRTADPRMVRFDQANHGESITQANPKQWVPATAQDIVRMSATPAYQEIAKALLTNTQAVVDIVDRFLTGDLKPIWDDVVKSIGNVRSSTPLTNRQVAADLIKVYTEDILTRTAQDRVLIGSIATGKLGETAIRTQNAWNLYDASEELKTFITQNLLGNPKADVPVLHFPTSVTPQVAEDGRMFTRMYNFYRNADAKWARNPLSDYHKWKFVTDAIPTMDPEEALKMIEGLEKSYAAEPTSALKWLIRDLRERLPLAEGKITRKEMEINASIHGQIEEDKLLYNQGDRSYFGSKHSLFFGFFDAWFEQWAVWTRLMANNPTLIQKASIAKKGLLSMQLPSWGGGVANDGVVVKDEDTGQMMVTFGFSNKAFDYFGLNAETRMSTNGLTLVGQTGPGSFGWGGLILDSVAPNSGIINDIRQQFQPFGAPKSSGEVAKYFIPSWGQAVIGGLSQALQQTSVTRKFDFFDNIAALTTTEQSDTMLQMNVHNVMENMAANSPYIPVTETERKQRLREAYTKGAWLTTINGLFKALLPGSTMTKFYVDTQSGPVTKGAVMDDLRAITDEAIKNGEGYSVGVEKFLDKYGPGAFIFLSGAREYVPGMQSTKEFAAWEEKNSSLLGKYPLVAGFMGPQDGEFELNAFISQSASGSKNIRDIETRQNNNLSSLAWMLYNQRKNGIIKQGVELGLTPQQIQTTDGYKNGMREKSAELKKLYPMWDPVVTRGQYEEEWNNQARQIELMVADKNVLKLDAGVALKEYWDFRNERLNKAFSDAPEMDNEVWKTSPRSEPLRTKLFNKGLELIKKYPEFSALWDRVLSQEFEMPQLTGDM
jgi:hypothetical protein